MKMLLASFRRRFLKEIEGLFVQVLLLAREMKLLKPRHIALDGTKIKANASKYKALSWGHANRIAGQLREEVRGGLLALAERQAYEARKAKRQAQREAGKKPRGKEPQPPPSALASIIEIKSKVQYIP